MNHSMTVASLGAWAMAVLLQTPIAIAAPEVACPDEWDGIDLSDRQMTQLEELEAQIDAQIEAVMPVSPESERQIMQLEEEFEAQLTALFSREQKAQIRQLDHWFDQQERSIAPELFVEEDEPPLTREQEAQIEAMEAEYEHRFQTILSAQQQQRIALLEEQLEQDIEAVLPDPTAAQEAQIEALEAVFEHRFMGLFTAQQWQQWERNVACHKAQEV